MGTYRRGAARQAHHEPIVDVIVPEEVDSG